MKRERQKDLVMTGRQGTVVLTAAATPSGTCLSDMHILRPCPRPAESHSRGRTPGSDKEGDGEGV